MQGAIDCVVDNVLSGVQDGLRDSISSSMHDDIVDTLSIESSISRQYGVCQQLDNQHATDVAELNRRSLFI